MPKLLTKIEGRGNGIKTNIVNMVDVAKSLGRLPSYPTKSLDIELQFAFEVMLFIDTCLFYITLVLKHCLKGIEFPIFEKAQSIEVGSYSQLRKIDILYLRRVSK